MKRYKKKINNKSDYIAMLLILLSSGTQYFFRNHGAITMISFLLYAIYYHINNRNKANTNSIFFTSIYVIYICINWFFINPNHYESINRLGPYLIFAVGAYLILSKMTRTVIINSLFFCVKYMAIISIVVFVLVELGLLTYRVIHVNDKIILMSCFHTVGWEYETFHRLAGLWWEPGAYQIVLNMALFFKISTYENVRQLWGKNDRFGNIIIFLASLLTLSTTGYIMLGMLFIYIIVKFNRGSAINKIFFLIITSPFYIFVCYLIYMSDPIQTKLEQSQSDSRSSYTIRYLDNVALATMIKEKPLTGYGLGTREFRNRSLALNNETSSNGDLFFMALFGIPLYLLVLFKCVNTSSDYRIHGGVFLLFFIMFNIGECFLYYPLIFLFLINPSKSIN